MRVTVEDLKHIDVPAYIDFIENTCRDIHEAFLLLPGYKERLNKVVLRRWNLHCYYIQNNRQSVWFEKFDALIEQGKEVIKELESNLIDVICLVDIEAIQSITGKDGITNEAFKIAETLDFNDIFVRLKSNRLLFETSIETDIDELKNKLQFDKNAIKRQLEKGASEDFPNLEFILDGVFCRTYLTNSNTVFEFARIEYLHRLANWENRDIAPGLSLKAELTQAHIKKLHTGLSGVFDATLEQWQSLFSNNILLKTPIRVLHHKSDVAVLFYYLREKEYVRNKNFPSILEQSNAFSFEGKIMTSKQIRATAQSSNFPLMGNSDLIETAITDLI